MDVRACGWSDASAADYAANLGAYENFDNLFHETTVRIFHEN
jgi:hypothetical protein